MEPVLSGFFYEKTGDFRRLNLIKESMFSVKTARKNRLHTPATTTFYHGFLSLRAISRNIDNKLCISHIQALELAARIIYLPN
jgi:hypothetical protein